MDPIRLQFQLNDQSKQEEIARDLELRFRALPVEKVTTKTGTLRDPTTVLAAIGVGIVIARDGKKLARSSKEVLKELIEIAKVAAKGWVEITTIFVGVGSKQVPLSQLTDEDLEQLAAAD